MGALKHKTGIWSGFKAKWIYSKCKSSLRCLAEKRKRKRKNLSIGNVWKIIFRCLSHRVTMSLRHPENCICTVCAAVMWIHLITTCCISAAYPYRHFLAQLPCELPWNKRIFQWEQPSTLCLYYLHSFPFLDSTSEYTLRLFRP